jgi:hypothetical protein
LRSSFQFLNDPLYRLLTSIMPLFQNHNVSVRTSFSLPYTFSLTSGWRFLCVDVLHKPKPVKNIWLTADEAVRDIAYDPEQLVVTTWLLVQSAAAGERDEQLHLDPVLWSYAPGWWDKPPLINARVETAASSRMFKTLWQHGRAICFADGWFEWKKATRNSPTSYTAPT